MTLDEFTRKILSRKFLASLAAFLAAFCMGAAGVLPPEWTALGMALSAGIYAACEAYVDGKAAMAQQSVTNVTATTYDSATVAALLNAKGDGDEAREG